MFLRLSAGGQAEKSLAHQAAVHPRGDRGSLSVESAAELLLDQTADNESRSVQPTEGGRKEELQDPENSVWFGGDFM